MRYATVILAVYLTLGCAKDERHSIKLNNCSNIQSDISNRPAPQYLEINFIGEDTCDLDFIFSNMDLSKLETLVVLNESIELNKTYVTPKLMSIDLLSKDSVTVEFLGIPDTISILNVRGRHIDLGSSLSDKCIEQLRLEITSWKLPEFVTEIGTVYYLTISGNVCDKMELQKFRKFENLNLDNSCMKKTLNQGDSLEYGIVNDDF